MVFFFKALGIKFSFSFLRLTPMHTTNKLFKIIIIVVLIIIVLKIFLASGINKLGFKAD